MNMNFTPAPKMDQVLDVLATSPHVTLEKRREYETALRSLEKWCGQGLTEIPATVADLREIYSRLEPAALGIRPKTFANVKSLSLSALSKSELVPGMLASRSTRQPKSPEWAELWNRLRLPVQQNSLSRLVNWCSRAGIAPHEVNSRVVDRVMADMTQTSLRPNQYQVHRSMAKVWNEVVDIFPEKRLQKVNVPISRLRRTRVPRSEIPDSFLEDWNAFAAWAHGDDVFAEDARPTRLRQTTLDSYFRRIHLAVTSLVQTGVEISSITKLADLVTVDAFKRILRHLHEAANGKPSTDVYFMAQMLIPIARDWVKADHETVAELRGLVKKIPRPIFEMTRKNKLLVMRFDDPQLKERFLSAPDRMWRDIQASERNSHWRLAEAQAALGVEFLMFLPIRLGNLTALAFDEHLFLRAGGTSTLLLSAEETKTGTSVEFDIPARLAGRLIEYRDVIAPEVMGHKPKYLFSTSDGSVKGFAAVRYLVQRYLKQYVGLHMNPHAFRHLAAKFILDASPGAHVLVQHLLGHKTVATTATYYAGLDTRRAGRHHHTLLNKALHEHHGKLAAAKRSRRKRSGREQ